jgi:predicted nucleic acid-binding Zn ribbon protein
MARAGLESVGGSRDPQPLATALAELIALRGFARKQGHDDLQRAWEAVAEPEWASMAKPLKIQKGVLHVSVGSAALLSQLASFHAVDLTGKLQAQYPRLQIRSLKFQLAGR